MSQFSKRLKKISFKKTYPDLKLKDFFKFGKYKNCRIEFILEHDPKYIQWLCDSKHFTFSEEVVDQLQQRILDYDNKMFLLK